ncbi:MAG: hypothetical protein IPP69_17885 [Flavobacteriales bacterium]|nr:hypothetical protein [Flavobacteriales bacterium]
MKKILSTLSFALLALINYATVHTVSNNPNSPGEYNNLQTAIDAATNGDTLYVHGSPTSYGNIYLNRNLTLIGTGYNPQKDNPLVSSIATLYLDSVPGIKGCSNSRIIGFNITSQLLNGPSGYAFNNITVAMNKIAQLQLQPTSANNIVLKQNIINYVYIIANCNNLILRNNMIYYTASYFQNCNSVLISNNLFFYQNVSTATTIMDYSTVTNNIFLNVHPNSNFATYNNNLIFNSGSDLLPYGNNTGTGNINGSAPIFVNVPDLIGVNFSYNYRLAANSPGHNAGTDGTDIGPFGGVDPLPNLYGTPPVPQIKIFNITNSVVTPDTPLEIYVKAKKQ